MGNNMSVAIPMTQIHDGSGASLGSSGSSINSLGSTFFQPDILPTYDPRNSYDAVLGCGCTPPLGGAGDDWFPVHSNDLTNSSAIRVSAGDVDISIDRATVGRGFQCQSCYARGGGRAPLAFWTRRTWLEDRLDDMGDRLYFIENDIRRAYYNHFGRGWYPYTHRHRYPSSLYGRRYAQPLLGYGSGNNINLDVVNYGNLEILGRSRHSRHNSLFHSSRYY